MEIVGLCPSDVSSHNFTASSVTDIFDLCTEYYTTFCISAYAFLMGCILYLGTQILVWNELMLKKLTSRIEK